jgi:hypothetical protein
MLFSPGDIPTDWDVYSIGLNFKGGNIKIMPVSKYPSMGKIEIDDCSFNF